jgi:NDP-sugar pyrophosphorylase family protein
MNNKPIALVLMVAGMSSRFGGRIKQFAKVGPSGETLIEYSINQALKANFNKIVFIVGEKTEKPFREMFGNEFKGVPVKYAVQTYNQSERDRPWGTVDAVCAAEPVIDCPFVVCNGDDIYGDEAFIKLAEHLRQGGSACTVGYPLLSVLPEQGNVNRGIFKANGGNVEAVTETFGISKSNYQEKGLADKELCSMNIFGLNEKVLPVLHGMLISFKNYHKDDRKSECLLPTELNSLIHHKAITMKLLSTSQTWYGVTNPEDEEIIRQLLKQAK